jgi:uncharacterized membrane protein YdbT with pleckstrin-like domain
MRYMHKTLLENEQIIYMTRPHWIVFTPSILTFVIALLVFGFGPAIPGFNLRIYNLTVYEAFALLLGAYALLHFIKTFITYHSSEYGITNKRVIMKTGWIQRNALEIFLDKVEGVHVDQTIPGRILKYGSVMIIGTGGSKDPFVNVPRPLHFRKLVQQEMDYAEERFRPAH